MMFTATFMSSFHIIFTSTWSPSFHPISSVMEFLRSDSGSSQASEDTEAWSNSSSDNTRDLVESYNFQADDQESGIGEETKDEDQQECKLDDEQVPRSVPVVSGGFFYTKYHKTATTTNYRCSSYKRTNCKAKLYVRADGSLSQTGEHTPTCNREIVWGTDADPATSSTILAADIIEAIDELAVTQPTLQPAAVIGIIRERFYTNANTLASGISKTQVQGRFYIYRTKLKSFGNDIFVSIKTEPLCNVRENSDLRFFQFRGSYNEDIVNRTNNPLERYNRTLNRAMGEANPEIGKFGVVLEREGHKFVDTLADVANRGVRTPRHVRPHLTSTAIERDEESVSDVEEGASDTSLSTKY
ncbi:unnamed protein product [Phytophthora fragariaefolia]|uniref:Unnamed protein product n=1 Tax=Phytophthora fragariaefolia TaxID=1490495 RepID=A0A9W7D073_9STRA|nr:unnamed protein product [Phytophthora fragariaefolia]